MHANVQSTQSIIAVNALLKSPIKAHLSFVSKSHQNPSSKAAPTINVEASNKLKSTSANASPKSTANALAKPTANASARPLAKASKSLREQKILLQSWLEQDHARRYGRPIIEKPLQETKSISPAEIWGIPPKLLKQAAKKENVSPEKPKQPSNQSKSALQQTYKVSKLKQNLKHNVQSKHVKQTKLPKLTQKSKQQLSEAKRNRKSHDEKLGYRDTSMDFSKFAKSLQSSIRKSSFLTSDDSGNKIRMPHARYSFSKVNHFDSDF